MLRRGKQADLIMGFQMFGGRNGNVAVLWIERAAELRWGDLDIEWLGAAIWARILRNHFGFDDALSAEGFFAWSFTVEGLLALLQADSTLILF